MKLLFLTSGERTPSTRFRMIPWARRLRELGHRCTVSHSFPEKYEHIPWLGFRPSQFLKRTMRRVDLWRIVVGRYDAVILERELFDADDWRMEELLRRVAKTLVLDIDDGVFVRYPEKFERLREMADLVVAGNGLLEQWALEGNPHVVVTPTCIDTEEYVPTPASGTLPGRLPVIGWMGTAGNITYLKQLQEPLRALAAEHEFEFRVIATHRGTLDELDLRGVRLTFQPWDPATEVADIRSFDVGVMPLTADRWSRYKCGLKLLQYMAVGVPGVASPVGVNQEIVTEGSDGYLTSDAEGWRTALGRLLRDPDERREMGRRARETVERRYSVHANLDAWVAAVGEAIARRTG